MEALSSACALLAWIANRPERFVIILTRTASNSYQRMYSAILIKCFVIFPDDSLDESGSGYILSLAVFFNSI
jgi:hypothetical protein